MEKSGGRVVEAKTYDELKYNFKNDLTTYEEKKKIFVTIINKYSQQWDKDKSLLIYLFSKKYDVSESRLSDCNSLMTDILKIRQFINQDKYNYFDKNTYYLIGFSLNFALKRVAFDHDFSENEYSEFKNIMNTVIKNTFKEKSEQIIARFNLLSCFKTDNNKNFKQFVKKDIIESQKSVYEILHYTYANQIMQRCDLDGSELSGNWELLVNNSVLSASEEIICFLSGKRDDFTNVLSIFGSIDIERNSEKAFDYYFKNNAQNELSNKLYIEDINRICQFFTVPSMGSTDFYQKNTFERNQFLSEIPEFIPMNEIAKNRIIALDSVSRRYSKIQQILDFNKISDPCYISKYKDWFIHTSDSLALINDVYILNNRWPIGSRITMVYNNGKDTSIGYIAGKKINNTTKEFEVIETIKSKSINQNYTVLFQTARNGYTYDDLKENENEKRLSENFNNSSRNCEEKLRNEKEQKEREEYFRNQAAIKKQKEEQRAAEFKNVFNKTIQILKESSINVDTLFYKRIIQKVDDHEITIDSLFSLAYNLLLHNENYDIIKETRVNESDARVSLLLNLYFIYNLEQQNDNRKIIRDLINAATINLAHGYLLISIKNNVEAFDFASLEYKKISSSYKFDESFNFLTRDQMILADWNDFIEKGLVTKSQLNEFNNKYKIINGF